MASRTASAVLVLLISCGESVVGRLTTSKPTPVYEKPVPSWYKQPNRVVETIQPGASLPVRELHYGKEFLMLEVDLAAGGSGFVDSADVEWRPAAE